MRILSRYLGLQFSYMVGLATVLFLGIDLFFSLVDEMGSIGRGAFDMGDAFTLLLFSVPQKIYQWFPFSILMGTLLSLNQLSNHSELIVMRALRYSVNDIIKSLLKVGTLLILIVFALGEGVAPAFDRLGSSYRAQVLKGGQALATAQGIWMRDGQDFVHISNMKVDGTLEGITRYRFDDQDELVLASYSQSASFGESEWLLSQVSQSNLSPEQVSIAFYETQPWSTNMRPETLRTAGLKYLDQLSLVGLWQAIDYRTVNNLDANPYWLIFWRKIVQPFACLVMILVAVPFVFGHFRQLTTGVRMLFGILIGLGFYTLNAGFGPFTLLYGLPPVIGAMLPTVLVGFLAVRSLRKIY